MAKLISANTIRKPFESVLEEQGVLEKSAIAQYLVSAQKAEISLAVYLTQNKLAPEESVYRALADAYGLSYSNLPDSLSEEEIPERLLRICSRERLLVKELTEKRIHLYTCEPEKIRRFFPLFSALGYEPTFLVSPPSNFSVPVVENKELRNNQELFSGISSLADSFKNLNEGNESSDSRHDISAEAETDTSSIVDLVNKTLLLAVNQGASDIHAETTQLGARIRFRIDGVLTDRFELEAVPASTFISRLLIMSNLDITEKVMPQDGSFKVKCAERDVEFRIASMPGIYGQNLVLRLLSGGESGSLSLESLGMLPDELEIIKSTTKFTHGMILVAGPTGSGKSTTLYGLLEAIADPKMKFITIEDPVERRINGVQQIQVRINRNEPERSLTFAKGLRTVLRLDPDIIMVGEIRDADTAQISIQASLTGHLVLSTVHANSSVETLRRLENIGIDFHLLMSSLNLIFSQRLMRRLCPLCKKKRPANQVEKNLLSRFSQDSVFEPVGCPQCIESGYRGRVGIFEFLPFDENIKDIIAQEGLTVSMPAVREKRLRTLLESGLLKISDGLSDFNELERVCGPCR